MGDCATCLWCDLDYDGKRRCHNPDCYTDTEVAKQAYRVVEDPWTEGCTLHEPI